MKNIYERMNAVMADMDVLAKASKSGQGYNFASYDSLMGVVHPLFVKHGITMIVSVDEAKESIIEKGGDKREFRTEVWLSVDFVNIDNPLDRANAKGYGVGTSARDVGPGIATSYGVKQVVLKSLSVPCGDDAEKSGAQVAKKEEKKTAAKEKKTETETKKSVYAEIVAKMTSKGGTEETVKEWMRKHKYRSVGSVSIEVLKSYLADLDKPGIPVAAKPEVAAPEPGPPPPTEPPPEEAGDEEGQIEF